MEETKTVQIGSLSELYGLTGLNIIKKDVSQMINLIRMQLWRKQNGFKTVPLSLHMVFAGNPGTGKTTVARIIGNIYKEIGILSKGHLIEVERVDLVAGYVGQTAIKTQAKIEEARGGILFIDEAYSLNKGENDYGHEAIEVLLKAMEDYRDDLIVIVAGYPESMSRFIESNPGLASRFNKWFDFPDYNEYELYEIFHNMCLQYDYLVEKKAEIAIKDYMKNLVMNKGDNFANARDVRNYFEEIISNQATRVMTTPNTSKADMKIIMLEDLTGKDNVEFLDNEEYRIELLCEDENDEIKQLKRLALQGDIDSQIVLGELYDDGIDVPRDIVEAAKWYGMAAAQGSIDGQFMLGYLYDQGGKSIQNYKEAAAWYKLAANQGHRAAQYYLGFMYYCGHGVKQDYSEAANWYELSAEQSFAKAQFMLGKMYLEGQGVTQDKKRAVKLFKMAVENGSSDAIEILKTLDVKEGEHTILQFGSYPQYDCDENDPIDWLVLEKKGNSILLISLYGLDAIKMNEEEKDFTWETCELRKWLNTVFYNTAFNDTERAHIKQVLVHADRNPSYDINPGGDTQDRIFLLSIKEANMYFSSNKDRQCKRTRYTLEKDAYDYLKYKDEPCAWRLRTPGINSETTACIEDNGSISCHGWHTSYTGFAVRPAMWITREVEVTNGVRL